MATHLLLIAQCNLVSLIGNRRMLGLAVKLPKEKLIQPIATAEKL